MVLGIYLASSGNCDASERERLEALNPYSRFERGRCRSIMYVVWRMLCYSSSSPTPRVMQPPATPNPICSHMQLSVLICAPRWTCKLQLSPQCSLPTNPSTDDSLDIIARERNVFSYSRWETCIRGATCKVSGLPKPAISSKGGGRK